MKSNNKFYIPNPKNTSHIELPEKVFSNLELFACNVHEEWAKRRIDDGWRYGPFRDEEQKLHPSLIPYVDLPEVEKEYDRITVISTLKMLISCGYKII